MTSAPTSDDFPIVDPHQHFWDLGRNYYPWLCDPKPTRFRYGDTAPLRRNYLPLDYIRDAGALEIVKTVHVEASWDASDPVGETRWLEQVALEHFDVSLGTGLSKVAGKVFRIGHLGDTNDLTIIGALAGVEMALALNSVPHKGAGVRAAMDHFTERAKGR